LIILNQFIFRVGERVVDGNRRANCLAKNEEINLDSIIDKTTDEIDLTKFEEDWQFHAEK